MDDYMLSLTINILNQLWMDKNKNIFDNFFIHLEDSIHKETTGVSNFIRANRLKNQYQHE